jgi:hypothetical protein
MLGIGRREFTTLCGGAVTFGPLSAWAAQSLRPLIALLEGASAASMAASHDAFRAGLHQLGYVQGQNCSFEFRYANGFLRSAADRSKPCGPSSIFRTRTSADPCRCPVGVADDADGADARASFPFAQLVRLSSVAFVFDYLKRGSRRLSSSPIRLWVRFASDARSRSSPASFRPRSTYYHRATAYRVSTPAPAILGSSDRRSRSEMAAAVSASVPKVTWRPSISTVPTPRNLTPSSATRCTVISSSVIWAGILGGNSCY